MGIEEKLELLERMRRESQQNEYRMQYGRQEEEISDTGASGKSRSYTSGFQFRLAAALFLFLVFCGISSSKDVYYQNISEEIMKYLQNDWNIGYNENTDFLEGIPDLFSFE